MAAMVISQAMQAAGRSHLAAPVRPEDRVAALAAISLDDVREFARAVFGATRLEIFAGGDVNADLARAVSDLALRFLQPAAVAPPGMPWTACLGRTMERR